jgi:hypothetical protein
MPTAHQIGRVPSGDVEIFYRRLGTPGRTPLKKETAPVE